MYIPELKYHKPKSLEDAYKLINTSSKSALIAGGTDILVEMKQGVRAFDNIISLNGLPELKTIEDKDDKIIIGSGVTHGEIQKSDIIQKYIPALAQAVSTIGTHQIRNTATVGGNLCTCASCADSAPILIIYDADIEIGSENGTRIAKLADFFIGHHINALQQGEILLKIIVPKPPENFCAYFEKFGLRESASISVASIAVGLSIENEIVKDANVIIGACAPTPMKSENTIALMINKPLSEFKDKSDLMIQIGEAASKDVLPIDDIRGSAEYRRNIVKVLTQRVILKAIIKSKEFRT